jgi:hypothetical protein
MNYQWREANISDSDQLALLDQKMELLDSWRTEQFEKQLSNGNILVAYNKWHGQLTGYLCYNDDENSLAGHRLRAREPISSLTLINAIEDLSSLRNKQHCVIVTRDDNQDLDLHLMLVAKNFRGELARRHNTVQLVFSKIPGMISETGLAN